MTRKTIHQTLETAGNVLEMLREYKRHESKDKRVFAAALASLTAESMGGKLHTYNEFEGLTLIASEWTQSGPPRAVLLSRPFSNWAAAVAFWCVIGQNGFANEEEWSFFEERDLDLFIINSTYGRWLSSPPGSALRWAEAVRIYENSGLPDQRGHSDVDHDEWNWEFDNLKPELLAVLGYDSLPQILHQIDPRLAEFEKVIKVLRPAEREIEYAIMEREFFTSWLGTVQNLSRPGTYSILQLAQNVIARPLPTHIPIEVLRNRGELSPAQALAWYLVAEERGPKLTYATAASMLGMKNRQEIGTHLKRARETLSKSDQKLNLSGIVRYEYLYEEAPEAIEIDLTRHLSGESAEEGRYRSTQMKRR